MTREGQKVGRYLLSKQLGAGMFSKVLLATDYNATTSYAVKIMHKENLEQLEMAKYARREATILRKLSHPNIVQFIEAIQSDTKLFLVMELVPGIELLDVVSSGPLPESLAKIYISQLLDAVSYLHSRGIVHRDLKPDNILVDVEKQRLKLIDFGLTGISRQNAMMKTSCGSCYYSAPEVTFPKAEGYNGSKADAWSIGILSYILLTASHPFVDGDGELLSDALKQGQVEYPTHLSKGAIHFLARLLTTDPRKRYSSAQAGLHPWLTGCPVTDGDKTVGRICTGKRVDSSCEVSVDGVKVMLGDRENSSSPSLHMRRRSSQRQNSSSFLWFRRNRVASATNSIPLEGEERDGGVTAKRCGTVCMAEGPGGRGASRWDQSGAGGTCAQGRRVKRRGSLDRRDSRVTLDFGNRHRPGHESLDGSPVRRQPSLTARTRALLRTPFLAASVQT